jgi:acetoin utilization protein AcuB
MTILKSKARKSVAAFMTRQPLTIGPDDTLAQARALMKTHHIRHLPVVVDGEPVGVVSERDLDAIERYHDVDPTVVAVHEAMAPLTYAVTPSTSLEEVVGNMAENRYGSALVIGPDGKLAGVFTTVDALRATLALCKASRRKSQA